MQARNLDAKFYLIIQGVRANRMGSAGKGETQPHADNKTKQGKAENRRVELLAH